MRLVSTLGAGYRYTTLRLHRQDAGWTDRYPCERSDHGNGDEDEASAAPQTRAFACILSAEECSHNQVSVEPFVIRLLSLNPEFCFRGLMTWRLAKERRGFGRITLSHAVIMT